MSRQDVIDAELEDCHRLFIQGDTRQLFRAVIYCGKHSLPPPWWVTEALESITLGYTDGTFKSMDEVFHTQRPKYWQQHTHYKKNHIDLTGLTLPEKIYHAVQAESRKGRAIDKQLFEDIGKQFHVSAGTVDVYYGEAKRAKEWCLPHFTTCLVLCSADSTAPGKTTNPLESDEFLMALSSPIECR